MLQLRIQYNRTSSVQSSVLHSDLRALEHPSVHPERKGNRVLAGEGGGEASANTVRAVLQVVREAGTVPRLQGIPAITEPDRRRLVNLPRSPCAPPPALVMMTDPPYTIISILGARTWSDLVPVRHGHA